MLTTKRVGLILRGNGPFTLFGLTEPHMDDQLRTRVREYVVTVLPEWVHRMSARSGKSREEAIEHVTDLLATSGLGQSLEKFHDEHGVYPPMAISELLHVLQGSPPQK